MNEKSVYIVFLYNHTHHKKVRCEIHCPDSEYDQVVKAMKTPAMQKEAWNQAYPVIRKEVKDQWGDIVLRPNIKKKTDVIVIQRDLPLQE